MFQLAVDSLFRYRTFLERFFRSACVPTALACALLLAAFLKGHELATEELGENSLFTSRWFLALLVLWEGALASWLLSGLHPRLARAMALLTFLAFFQAALYLAASGEASCRCLGKASTNPWFMVGFDVLALAVLVAWTPAHPGASIFTHRRRFATVAIIYVLVAIPALINMLAYTPRGQMRLLRHDPSLAARLNVQLKGATTQQLLDHLHSATGLHFSVESGLAQTPDLGQISTNSARAWAIMELLAQRQNVPARWKKTDGGYLLVRSAPFGIANPWLVSASVALGLVLILLLFSRRPTQGIASKQSSVWRALYFIWQPDHHRATRSAFSLVELLVVMGMIVLLLAIVFPAVQKVRDADQQRSILFFS